jgi:hypothetical protein
LPQQRITLFAKGNVDLRDSLVAQRSGGAVVWNGINEVLRAQHVPATVRVRHETHIRADALAAADGIVPPVLLERPLPLGAYPLASQFSRAFFDTPADAYLLSAQADGYTVMFRHRREGFLLHAPAWREWPAPDLAWLREHFVPTGLLEPPEAVAQIGRVVARLRERTQAPVLVYNLVTVMPGDSVHCYAGLDETLATRARRINLELVELSRATGASIVDADRAIARAGTDRCLLDPLHFTPEGCRVVAQEVVRILQDLDVLPQPAA